ncbi:MAG: penicillin acylase family protein, partial [Rhizobiaceae bacterium]
MKRALLWGVAMLAVAGPADAQAIRPAPMSTATAGDLIPQAVIRRDTFGVPHIIAETDEAAAFAMGYAVAEDHAVEMGKLYLQARGDAARWFGPVHVEDDLAMKRMDNLEGARRALERTGEGYRRWLHGFVTGVNHYAELHRAELPAWFPTVTEADIIAFSRRGAAEAAVRAPQTSGGEGDDGSNALAIAKTHSTTGAPILLANPHLRWTAQYWEAHITVPGQINFYGSLTVGLAVLRAGFGENIGYAQTNNNVDLVDHYAVPLAPGRPDHYVFKGRTQPFLRQSVSVEVLQPTGRIDTVTREYEATDFGPVVNRTATHAVVSRSHGADAWHFHEGYYELYFAKNLDSFMKVMSRQMIPSSNFTYADGDGNIMYLWNAAVPKRPP